MGKRKPLKMCKTSAEMVNAFTKLPGVKAFVKPLRKAMKASGFTRLVTG